GEDFPAVARIRANLLATDEELVGAVDRREQGAGSSTLLGGARLGACTWRRTRLLPALRSLLLQILPHTFPTALAPESRFPVPPEPRGRVEQIGAIDPHDARFDLGRYVEREVDVLGPHARREAVRRVVRELHGLGGGAARHRDEHRAEDRDLGAGGRGRSV